VFSTNLIRIGQNVKYFAVLALLFCAAAPAAEKLSLSCPTYPDCGNSQRVFDVPGPDTMVSTEAGWVRFGDADEVLVCLDDLEPGAHTSECPRDRKVRVPRCEVAGAECNTGAFTAVPSAGYAPLAIDLQWDIPDAETCTASGSWAGEKPAKGSQGVTNLTADAAYVLTCAMPATGEEAARLSWAAVTRDEKGNAITVQGYRVYRATDGEFDLVETLCGAGQLKYADDDLPDGVYRFRATAFRGSSECSKIDKESDPSPVTAIEIGKAGSSSVHTVEVTRQVSIKYPPTAPVVTAP
jgi:hypothetical protein